MVLRFKRGIPRNHLINGNTNCPQVNSFIITSANVYLRSKIEMRSNDSEHISSGTSLKSLFSNLKINKFDFLCFAIIKYVFKLDISMANVSIVDIFNCSYNLPDNMLYLFLIFYGIFSKIGVTDILHNQISVSAVKVKSSIFDDGRMIKSL